MRLTLLCVCVRFVQPILPAVTGRSVVSEISISSRVQSWIYIFMAVRRVAVALQSLIKRLSGLFWASFSSLSCSESRVSCLLMCYMKQHLCCEVVHLTHKTIKTWFSLFNSHLNVFHDVLLQKDAEILPETHSSNKRSYFWDVVVFFCVTKNKILYIYLHHNNLTVQLLVTLQMNNLKD